MAEQEEQAEPTRQLKLRIESLEKELTQEREKATDYMNRRSGPSSMSN